MITDHPFCEHRNVITQVSVILQPLQKGITAK
jgi:hypothetical protein